MRALTLSIPSEQWRVQATFDMGHLQLLESIGHVQAERKLALMRALTLSIPSEQWRVQATLDMGPLQILESIGHWF